MSGRAARLADLWRRCIEAWHCWRYGPLDPRAKLGLRGEQAAARLLRRNGLVIIAHGHADPAGEIDLIAVDRKRQTIVFVEVKTLATDKPGHPAERVDEQKQARLTRAALRYLKRQRLLECRCRFDVVAVWWPETAASPTRMEHYRSAFEATGVDGFYS